MPDALTRLTKLYEDDIRAAEELAKKTARVAFEKGRTGSSMRLTKSEGLALLHKYAGLRFPDVTIERATAEYLKTDAGKGFWTALRNAAPDPIVGTKADPTALEVMAEKIRRADVSLSPEQAYVKVLDTAEGREEYRHERVHGQAAS